MIDESQILPERGEYKPLVSVITIFLDAEKFINEALESVFAQSYSNWELLLIDDGSTDGSTAVARRCAEQNPGKVRYLSHPNHSNRGMSASRNLGIAHARGQYVSFLDADDILFPSKIAEQVAILNAHPRAAMVYGPVQFWYSWTGAPEDHDRDYVPEIGFPPGTIAEPYTLLRQCEPLGDAPAPWTCTVMARMTAVRQVGGFEEVFRGFREDYAFYIKMFASMPVFVSDRCWARYRQHSTSCCASLGRGELDEQELLFLHWISSYLAENSVDDFYARRLLKRKLWALNHPILNRLWRFFSHRIIPPAVYRRLKSRWKGLHHSSPAAHVSFRELRRLTPYRRRSEISAGASIPEYYIECFLNSCHNDIQGRILEIELRRNRALPVSGKDSARGDCAPAYDCILAVQSLSAESDLNATMRALSSKLKCDGVLLVTLPGIVGGVSEHGTCWGFTPSSATALFSRFFPANAIRTFVYGNVLSALSTLHGLTSSELTRVELDFVDPEYPVVVAVRAQKAAGEK